MNPKELDRDTSIYDFETHTPYPTLAFIRNRTGEDLILNKGGETKARAEIRQLTDMVKGYMRVTMTLENINYMEYLVAKDSAWRNDFIEAVSKLVYYKYNDNTDLKSYIREVVDNSDFIRFKSIQRPKNYIYRGDY